MPGPSSSSHDLREGPYLIIAQQRSSAGHKVLAMCVRTALYMRGLGFFAFFRCPGFDGGSGCEQVSGLGDGGQDFFVQPASYGPDFRQDLQLFQLAKMLPTHDGCTAWGGSQAQERALWPADFFLGLFARCLPLFVGVWPHSGPLGRIPDSSWQDPACICQQVQSLLQPWRLSSATDPHKAIPVSH